MKMHLIPGDERNFKITTNEDLVRFTELVKG
jgi:2-C-methyl-D-erythritol 4-phosphate cytidylyltransferase